MEERFPDWDVQHTGGGIWVIRKNFVTRTGKKMMVSVADTGAILFKKIMMKIDEQNVEINNDEYITFEEYKEEENLYSEFEYVCFEEVFSITNNGWKLHPIANLLFEQETLDELEYHAELLNQL